MITRETKEAYKTYLKIGKMYFLPKKTFYFEEC